MLQRLGAACYTETDNPYTSARLSMVQERPLVYVHSLILQSSLHRQICVCPWCHINCSRSVIYNPCPYLLVSKLGI